MEAESRAECVSFYAVTTCSVARRRRRRGSSRCLCQVGKSDHCRARAVSAHSTCGLVRSGRTRPSSTGWPPARENTDTHARTHTRTGTRRERMHENMTNTRSQACKQFRTSTWPRTRTHTQEEIMKVNETVRKKKHHFFT